MAWQIWRCEGRTLTQDKEDVHLNNSAFPRILELAREEGLMSLDPLGSWSDESGS